MIYVRNKTDKIQIPSYKTILGRLLLIVGVTMMLSGIIGCGGDLSRREAAKVMKNFLEKVPSTYHLQNGVTYPTSRDWQAMKQLEIMGYVKLDPLDDFYDDSYGPDARKITLTEKAENTYKRGAVPIANMVLVKITGIHQREGTAQVEFTFKTEKINSQIADVLYPLGTNAPDLIIKHSVTLVRYDDGWRMTGW